MELNMNKILVVMVVIIVVRGRNQVNFMLINLVSLCKVLTRPPSPPPRKKGLLAIINELF
ncbi:hypothetical protein Avbf_14287 [Armadillidium vulgare]|nr:hypothetical protein Avbf_14287 [Armadillidium vulgare]